jgi:hypothetical protein
MKKLSLLLIAIAALFTVPTARAQSYDVASATITSNSVVVTAIAATATNTTVRASIPATRADNLGLQASFVLAGSGTSAVVLKFDESLDGSNWESAAHSLTVTANGTNSVVGVSTIALNGIGYLRLSSVENPNGQAINSLVIKYSQKIP